MKRIIHKSLAQKRFFSSQKGGVNVSSIVFYLTSALMILAIPVTVYVMRFQQQTLETQASVSRFDSPPAITASLNPAAITRGQTVNIDLAGTDTNWIVVFYSKDPVSDFYKYIQPLNDRESVPEGMRRVFNGVKSDPASDTPLEGGSYYVVAYQLRNFLEGFKSGDVVCGWDGGLYLFDVKSESVTEEIFTSLFNRRPEATGTWEKIGSCTNSGVLPVTVQ